MQQIGKKVYIWTANDPVSITSMISLGVDGLITDEPEMGQKVLAQRANMGTIERLLLHTTVLLGQPFPSMSIEMSRRKGRQIVVYRVLR